MTRTKKTSSPELRRSWLVQRLSKPRNLGTGPLAALGHNPFSFGGGLKNSGLSSDAMKLIEPIFRFEYMGSAEFEFGAVPEALQAIAKSEKRLVADSITFPLAAVAAHWSDKTKTPPDGDATVYILCHRDHHDEVVRRINGWLVHDNEFQTKEYVDLADTLRPGNYTPDTVGWLELDNGFMFFIDREMWEQAAALFGVKVEVSA